MNYSVAEMRGIKDVIPACPESFFALMYCFGECTASEGFPIPKAFGRNDRIRKILSEMQRIEEFL
jgi:hypothetical protein